MTPRETLMAMEAAAWRADVQHRQDAWLAWHVAMLQRAKRMPPLARLVAPPKARKLEGAELELRRAEYAEMVGAVPENVLHRRRDKR